MVSHSLASKSWIGHSQRWIVMCILHSLFGCAGVERCTHPGADTTPDEEAAVLDAVDRVLQAMATGDIPTYSNLLTPDGMTYSQRLIDGQWSLQRRSNQEDINLIATEKQTIAERYWQPTVLIRGPMAVVWAPYEFRKDGNVSHCGVDVFEMLKIDGRWIMGNAMWTVEPGGCDRLRPPTGTLIRPQEPAIR
jgi:hypothetical protein